MFDGFHVGEVKSDELAEVYIEVEQSVEYDFDSSHVGKFARAALVPPLDLIAGKILQVFWPVAWKEWLLSGAIFKSWVGLTALIYRRVRFS